jgi:hypothetical protein
MGAGAKQRGREGEGAASSGELKEKAVAMQTGRVTTGCPESSPDPIKRRST